MHKENEPATKINEAVLNELCGELYTIEANDKIPDDCKYPLALRRFSKDAQVKNWCKSNVNS